MQKDIEVALVATVAGLLITSAVLFLMTPREDADVGTYFIEVERSTEAPAVYITLNESDMEDYVISVVLDAFDNPDDHPNATLEGDVLFYETSDMRFGSAAINATDYLKSRLLAEHGERGPPYPFSYTGAGNETYYYLWYFGMS